MICPKCNYERQLTDDAPEWQCPSCKVAYVKAFKALNPESVPVEAGAYPDAKPAPLLQPEAMANEDFKQLRYLLASRGQKMVIYSVLLNFLMSGVVGSNLLPTLAVDGLIICIAVYSLQGILKICSGLGKSQNQKILFIVLAFIPPVNLIALVYLNAKATRMLREGGWEVGLLGVKS